MALKLGKVKAKAAAAVAPNYGKIKEGETLFAVVSVNGVEHCGTPTRSDGVPWTEVEILGGDDVWGIFKRIVMPLDQAYCQDQLFLEAAQANGLVQLDDGNPVLDENGQVQFAINSVADELVRSGKLTAEQVADARQTKYSWTLAPIAWRLERKAPWIPVFQKTQLFTESKGAKGKPAPHAILLEAVNEDTEGVVGNLDAYFDARLRGEKPSAPTIKLVKISRIGTSHQGTSYSGGVVTESDVKGFEQYYNFVPSEDMLDDMFGAVQPGAYANPHTFAAQTSIPSIEEMDRKIYGKGDAESKRSEMAEE